TGELSVRNLSGPVTIADLAGQTARIGWFAYVNFLALISISLGVLNLLPIPVLDGGHLVYYALEGIRGRPLSERFIELTQKAGLGVIMMMMALALFNDITRLIGSCWMPNVLPSRRRRMRRWHAHEAVAARVFATAMPWACAVEPCRVGDLRIVGIQR